MLHCCTVGDESFLESLCVGVTVSFCRIKERKPVGGGERVRPSTGGAGVT